MILRYNVFRKVKGMAKDIVQTATDKAHFLLEQTRLQTQNQELNLKTKSNLNIQKLKERNRKIQSLIDTMSYKNDLHCTHLKKAIQKRKQTVVVLNQEWQKKNPINEEWVKQYQSKHNQYLEKIKKHFSIDTDKLKKEIENVEKQKVQVNAQAQAQQIVEDAKRDADKNAVFILEKVMNRLSIPYCNERGISPVVLRDKKTFQYVINSKNDYLSFIEKKCGVDIVVDDKNLSLSVQGLDSVRREWGRLSLAKLSKKKRINKGILSSVVDQSKRELFQKIKKDGRRICKSLRLDGVSLEVCNMMGALRYRYSFAQNQHFHCEEVGWLCGLLLSELGESVWLGRRAGMFHDIGKAMDHAKEGGHAVIGADFIKKYGEKSEVVYAVRAHHYDVQPSHFLDFFVIAADAVSGSRPGARRSTVDSYNQKILSLERIGKGFDGVKNIYIMNAGRDMRVIVDSKKVNDQGALQLSKKITQKIEAECSYPGWIKVTVIRKVETNQMTRMAR